MGMRDVLVIILGGGQGTRLFPLTHMRSKPAVPIGGKYRLIDIPISNCLHVDLRRIFVLTQFNSASLNRHVASSYRLDQFSQGFVDIIAAEQTPENANWFQGTADAVRRAARHFEGYDADCYLILAGDHLYRMDLGELVRAHKDSGADITIAAQPTDPDEARAMGIFRFDADGQIVGFEEKPNAQRLGEIGSSVPPGATFMTPDPERPFVASLGIYVFSRDVLFRVLEEQASHVDFGREVIPAALPRYRVRPWIFRDYWADVGTIGSFYDANVALTQRGAAFRFYDARRPIYTRPRFLAASRLTDCRLRDAMVAEGSYLESCEIHESVVGIRTRIDRGSVIRRSVLLGADFYEDAAEKRQGVPALGIGRNVVLERVIVDKNARIGDDVRLVNEGNVDHADGDGWHIRDGVIVVRKGAVIPAGTVV
jgi:glucose-1-phosphate adenylyltransferase